MNSLSDEFQRLNDDMFEKADRIFNSFGHDIIKALNGKLFSSAKSNQLNSLKNIEYKVEYEKDWAVITMCLPGHKKDSIDISIENNIVTIETNNKAPRAFSKYRNSWKIDPVVYDLQKVEAQCEDGVLMVRFHKIKKVENKSEKITIKVG